MSLTELLPILRALPRDEKAQVAKLLLDELADEEILSMFKHVKEVTIDTPEFAPGSAAILDKLLREERETRKCVDTSS